MAGESRPVTIVARAREISFARNGLITFRLDDLQQHSLSLRASIPPAGCVTRARVTQRRQMVRARSLVRRCNDAYVVGVPFYAHVALRVQIQLSPILEFYCLD